MKDKLIRFFKNLSKLEWVTVGFLSGAVWMLVGLLVVLLTAAPEVGAIIMVIGLMMVLLAIPLIFACSLRRALRKAAQENEPIPTPEPSPAPEPIPTPEPKPAPEPIPTSAPQPTAAPEATVVIPKVQPQPAPKPKQGYIYLLDELEMKTRGSATEADLKNLNGITLVFARDKEGYALQMVRALSGSVETERFHLPADYFQTNTKNDFRIWLFKHGIFRVDVDLLWDDPAFLATIGD